MQKNILAASVVLGTAFLLNSLLVTSSTVHAAPVIVSAQKIAGNAEPINLLDGGLVDGVLAFTDRTHVLVDIPPGLVGGDLVQVSNSDRDSVPYQVNVTFGQLGLLYVGLDNRLTDGDQNTPATPLPWMSDTSMTGLPDGFFDTGFDISIDENADGTVNQFFSMFVSLAPVGTYSLFQQDDGTARNNYIIAASLALPVPEPSSLALLVLGALAAFGQWRCRRG